MTITREQMDEATRSLWNQYVGEEVDTDDLLDGRHWMGVFSMIELLNRALFGRR